MKRKKINNDKYIKYFYLLGIVFCIIGITSDSITNILFGTLRIFFSEDVLLTDYFKTGGFGAALINAGLVTIYTTFIIKVNKIQFSGLAFAAMFTLIGFSFFGKNVYNISPIYLGVYLFSLYRKEPFRQFIIVGIFATCLAPIVGANLFGSALGMIFSSLLGIFYGFVIVPLSSHVVKFHSGYTLYNVGFAGGIFAMVLSSIIKVFGIDLPIVEYLSTSYHMFFVFFILILSISFIFVALFIKSGFTLKEYKDLLNRPNRVISDYFSLYDRSIVLFNIGIVGLMLLGIVLCLNVNINGPIFGAIFTVMGFAAFGVNPKSSISIIIGVLLMIILTNNNSGFSTSQILVIIFAVGLSPLSSQYGPIIGIIAGMIHYAVVSQSAQWQGAMNLYNNGFASGITAAFIFGIVEEFNIGGRKR